MNRCCGGVAVHGFYALINWGARQKIPEDAGDFRLLSPRAAAALRQLPERNRFFKGLASWIGFRQIRVDYEPAPRAHGVTTFSAGRLVGLSIEGLTSFSVAPLRFASLLGVLLATVAFLFGLSILWETWTTGKSVPGYPSLVVGLMTIGGVQLIMIGIVGEYIGKILSELKARPIYFVAEHSEKRAETRDQPRAPANGPPPNERRRAAAPDLAVRRRLRHQPRRQPRHSRPDRARPSQRDLGDGGRPCDRPRRGRGAARPPPRSSPRCAIGLHATLTAPFRPLTMHFRPLDGGMFLPFPKLLRAGLLRRLDPEIIHAEVMVQLAAFAELFGRAPDFVDGHQHVQLFPQVRDAFLAAVKQAAPDAWVRQGGRNQPLAQRLGAPKALVLDILSAQFRRRAARAGIAFNPGIRRRL